MNRCCLLVFFLLFSRPAHAQMTPLDSAFVAASNDPSQAGRFYDRFLSTTLYVPTWEAGGPMGARRAGEDERFAPILIEAEGAQFMPVFDRLDRLETWADREITYVAMPAHALVTSIAGQDIHVALNVGTDYYKEFVPEEIAAVRQSMADRTEQTTIAAGTEIRIAALEEVPEGLQPALRGALERNPEVEEAYLTQIQFEGEAAPGYALVLAVDDAGQEHFGAIQEALGMAAREHLPDGVYLTILPLGQGGLDRDQLHTIEPFFVQE